jgi:hypothetical protein
VHDDGVIDLTRYDVGWGFDAPPLVGQFQDVFVFDAEFFGGGRANLCGIVPDQFGDRFGDFLEPAVVGGGTVAQGMVGAEDDFDGWCHWQEHRHRL